MIHKSMQLDIFIHAPVIGWYCPSAHECSAYWFIVSRSGEIYAAELAVRCYKSYIYHQVTPDAIVSCTSEIKCVSPVVWVHRGDPVQAGHPLDATGNEPPT